MSRPVGAFTGLRAGLVVAVCALGLAFPACGGDDDGGDDSEPATIEPATPTGPTGAAGEEGAEEGRPEDDHGDVDLEDGTVTPPPESESQAEGGTAAPESDDPPEPGSPEAEFERFCDENPEACS